MTRLVDDLLDVSRITHGRIQLRKEIVDLAQVVNQAVESVRPLNDTRGQERVRFAPAGACPTGGGPNPAGPGPQ